MIAEVPVGPSKKYIYKNERNYRSYYRSLELGCKLSVSCNCLWRCNQGCDVCNSIPYAPGRAGPISSDERAARASGSGATLWRLFLVIRLDFSVINYRCRSEGAKGLGMNVVRVDSRQEVLNYSSNDQSTIERPA
jgi:hypothetical protein